MVGRRPSRYAAGMAAHTETLSDPWRIDVTRDGDRLVEVKITANPGYELDPDNLRAAWHRLTQHLRMQDEYVQRRSALGPLEGPLASLRAAWEQAGGEITPTYLAALAVAYEHVHAEPGHGSIMVTLGEVIGRPPGTVKGHVVRARKEGYLSPVGPGQSGGDATVKARDLVNGANHG